MKLRIQENSIRLRLTQKEVGELRRAGRVEATICFTPGRALSYSIESLAEASEPTVTFQDNAIRTVIPAEAAIRWADTDEIGIEAYQAAGPNLELRLLIEKDFQCLHRTTEQEPDAYPNPLAR